jgi:hypothetical protein
MPDSYYILALMAFIFGVLIHNIVYLWSLANNKKGPALVSAGLVLFLFLLNLIIYSIDLIVWINHHVKIV